MPVKPAGSNDARHGIHRTRDSTAADDPANDVSHFMHQSLLVPFRATLMRVGNGCTVEITALSPAIGIEVHGLDFAQDLDHAKFEQLRTAWEENCVALFRDQHLSELDQVNFASRFGLLGRAVNDLDPTKGGAHPAILYVS